MMMVNWMLSFLKQCKGENNLYKNMSQLPCQWFYLAIFTTFPIKKLPYMYFPIFLIYLPNMKEKVASQNHT